MKWITVATIAMATCSVTLIPSQSTAQPEQCIRIESDLDRLACYDKEAGRTPTAEAIPMSTFPASPGRWHVSTEVSKLTDRKSVFLVVRSDEIVNCGWNKGDNIRLYLRCHENKTDVIFATDCHMTSSQYNSYGDIEYRIDTEKAKKVSGEESTDNKSLGIWGGAKSIPIIKQMLGKSKLVVRMTPYNQNPFTATFDISGLDTAIAPLRKECGW